VEQRCEPMDKNRIGGLRRRASWLLTTKPPTIKGAGGKSGGCALKAVRLIAGDLSHVPESGLRVEQFTLTVRQKSAEGIVVPKGTKA